VQLADVFPENVERVARVGFAIHDEVGGIEVDADVR
jgi:hypothetical protein